MPGSRKLCRRGSAGSERSLLGELSPAARECPSSFHSMGGADTVTRASRCFSLLPENTFVSTKNEMRVVLKTPGERTSLVPTPARRSWGQAGGDSTARWGTEPSVAGTCGSHSTRQVTVIPDAPSPEATYKLHGTRCSPALGSKESVFAGAL